MTSATTKRRKKRDVALLEKWRGAPVGTKVTVHRSNGAVIRTVTLCEPFGLHAGAYIRVQDISGNTHLRRVTRGWDATSEPEHSDERLPWGARAEKEVQRLRAAMVYAMAECTRIATLPDARSDVKRWAKVAVKTLKSALEEK